MYPRVVLEAMGGRAMHRFAWRPPWTFELLKRQVDVRGVPFRFALRQPRRAARCIRTTIDWAREAFRPSQLFVMTDQTEATARISFLPPERAADKRGSVGRPVEWPRAQGGRRHRDRATAKSIGTRVGIGRKHHGGYFAAPEETTQILKDGWLVTPATSAIWTRRASFSPVGPRKILSSEGTA